MPNSFFRFKRFIVHQDKCAMKVCTDACLFGSLIAALYKSKKIKRVLDIGTGTGLLSLMYAQKNYNAIIDAVEIDKQTADQAKENFEASPWSDRLNVYHTRIQEFNSLINQGYYDLIISNPPFFENDLKSKYENRNVALHSKELPVEELFVSIKNNLSNNGVCIILLPHNRSSYFEEFIFNNQFYLNKKILIKQTPMHNYFRNILTFSYQKTSIETTTVTIQDKYNQYSSECTELLKDYYLNL